jgi:prolyl-tRNA synthetase
MRTRLFLRTTEFLWQEGHTAHATKQEAIDETIQMMNIYAKFAEDFMAMPVIKGVKTESEKFAGAVDTYCIEALMQDGKALQAGTSHFLGQNFAKAFDVKFADKDGKLEYVWGTSWGATTRLMGALVMVHSDDNGLVLPPKLAPIQVAIVPIYKNETELKSVTEKALIIKKALEEEGISVKYDDRDTQKPGWKFAEYEFKGVPVRLAMGPRDLENNTIEVARRDLLQKESISQESVVKHVKNLLDEIQKNLFDRALERREKQTYSVDTWEEFEETLEKQGGFIRAHWDGTPETEALIKEKTKATVRCIELDAKEESGKCILSGKSSNKRVLFAKAY